MLAVWKEGKVRDSHVTKASNFVSVSSIYGLLTQRVCLLATFSSLPERHLSSVMNGDAFAGKDARASLKIMHADSMQDGIIFGFIIIMLR